MRIKIILFCLALFSINAAWAADDRLAFSLHKLESGQPGPTVLIVGGIQGDEPGGFHAASLLVTNYKITKGSVWVVPNLNFESIINRSRGMHGDMNRKFAKVGEDDPDFEEVKRIKELIVNPRIDMVFNLHDGSGFYRKEKIDNLHSPKRWGQSIIIDQNVIDVEDFSNVGDMSRQVSKEINEHLLDPEHQYAVKNTHTRLGDVEMEKTLTYFAINNGKSAVGIETSKSLPTHKRVYYHLHALESFFSNMGIEWERDFELSPSYVRKAIDSNLQIAFYQNKLLLDISKARASINYLPLQKNTELDFIANNPLLAITNRGSSYRINYGNRRITNINPQYFEYDASLKSVTIEADGVLRQVPMGNTIEVSNDFTVSPEEGYRFNIIGWKKKGVKSETGHVINQADIKKRFSLDREGNIYRLEVYKEKKFTGMVLVKFCENPSNENLIASNPDSVKPDLVNPDSVTSDTNENAQDETAQVAFLLD